MDLTIENITENVIKINSANPDARFKYVLERLVVHLHDFARETRLSTSEWMAAIQFLTRTGQICTDVRQVSERISSSTQNVYWPLVAMGRLTRNGRNLFSYPTFSASPSSSIASITRNRPIRPKARSWDLSTPTKPSRWTMAP